MIGFGSSGGLGSYTLSIQWEGFIGNWEGGIGLGSSGGIGSQTVAIQWEGIIGNWVGKGLLEGGAGENSIADIVVDEDWLPINSVSEDCLTSPCIQ